MEESEGQEVIHHLVHWLFAQVESEAVTQPPHQQLTPAVLTHLQTQLFLHQLRLLPNLGGKLVLLGIFLIIPVVRLDLVGQLLLVLLAQTPREMEREEVVAELFHQTLLQKQATSVAPVFAS
ncbi:hypothetical protein QU24_22955 [Pantoea rodasii]|uniref:Uncharacterized protein n=2 Tax=Pantoea TaxID=53335 RepID=A0A0U3UNT8_9GAMM|nr:hypothetical protein LK04_05130 [Pantoea vagans]KHJ65741.1 hypothetical protein QU24_22955 [Pantoea rodasii]